MYLRRKKANGKWYYRLETVDDYGNRKQIERAGSTSKTETRKIARKEQARLDHNRSAMLAQSILYKDFLKEWEKDFIDTGEVKPNTAKSYRSAMKNHILPTLGNVKLGMLTPPMLQRFLESLKKNYSKSTLNIIATVLKKSLETAVVFYGYLGASPAIFIHAPKNATAKRKQPVVFSEDEMKKIFQAFPIEHQFYAPICLAYYSGLRLGECLALKWDHVKKDSIIIDSTFIYNHGWEVQPVAKTKTANREISIGSHLSDVLERIKLRQYKNRLYLGRRYKKSGFVCTWDNGAPLTPDSMRFFNSWCKENLGHGSFHSLRHTYATELLEHGLDIELVSKQLGHSNINTTASFYSHVLESRRAKIAKISDDVLTVESK